ncbi:MAG: VOC family protein [Gammaproteobacteria bacterium]|nr:VOC family protein [Gammaproteobacteria bacterium]MDH5729809.1 VOC family protein [Gammaproteobacteria bacterium]
MIKSMLHASLIVADIKKSLDFYSVLLGLPVDTQRPDLGYPGAWLNLGVNQQIHLLELPNPDPMVGRPKHGGRDRHVAFAVDNLDALITILKQNNIAYRISRSGRRALFCRDPDANALEFIEQA